MKVTPRTVNEVRASAIWAGRAVSVLLVAMGCYLMLKRLFFGVLGAGDAAAAWNVWEGVGEGHSLFRGAALLVTGVALALLSRRIAAWVVVAPAEGCPGCGYATAGPADQTRCPECGLRGVQPGDDERNQG